MNKLFIIFSFIFLFLFTIPIQANDNINKQNTQEEEFLDEFDEFDEKQDEQSDILEPYNRFMTSFNDKIFIYIFNPVSNTYAKYVHKDLRIGVSNVFKNLLYPIRLSNNLLQGKFKNSYEETQRFVLNSTVGVFGIFDYAKTNLDINAHNEDFGQTLGTWGVPSGPHIVLPLLGPSNLRDGIALSADYYLDPMVRGKMNYKIPQNFTQESLIFGLNYVNKNSLNLGAYETFKRDSLDFYTFTRDFYEEKRKHDIKE